ncbi:MAG: hypothetical protein ACRELX_12510 [Longimicrobiales bacterium]
MRRAAVPLLLLALTTPLHGQTLSDRVSQLFTFGDCGDPLCLDVNAAVHGDHYNPSVVQGENNLLAFLNGAIGLSVGNLPFTAATSGVTFSFGAGAPVATTVSPGPIFGERAQTLGRGRLLVGATVNGIAFDNVRGVPLNDVNFIFTHQNTAGAALGDPTFERDIIRVSTNLDLSLLVTSLVASYGVTDRIDFGIALPIVRASLSGSSDAMFEQYDPGASPHYFGTDANRTLVAQSSASGDAIGIGDIGGRIKVNAYQDESRGVALVGDVRLPTGNEDDFLGSGATTVRVIGVASARFGNFTPHVNAGYQYTSASDLNNRLLATLGFDHLVSERVTVAGDLLGSFETGQSRLLLPDPVVYTAPDVRTVELTDIPRKDDNFVDASFGAKFSAGQDFRIIANVVFPLAKAGVRPTALWTVGLERTF